MKLSMYENFAQLTFIPNLFPVNCYLVKEEDGLTLIDAALPKGEGHILGAAKKLGIPITRIILTHGHADHVGALDALHATLPDVEILISARDARLLKGDHSLDVGEPDNGKALPTKPLCQTQPTGFLTEGSHIGSLEVISCPGHSPGHMALLDRRDRTLFAGDAYQVRGGIAVAGTVRPMFPFPAWGTWHKQMALDSAKLLRDYKPLKLAIGHGKVLADPLVSMDYAIAAAERRLLKQLSSAI